MELLENKKAQVQKPRTLLRPHRNKRFLPSRLITNITQIFELELQNRSIKTQSSVHILTYRASKLCPPYMEGRAMHRSDLSLKKDILHNMKMITKLNSCKK